MSYLCESPNDKANRGWISVGTTTLGIRGEHIVGFVAMNLADAPAYTVHFDYVHTTPENLIGGEGLSVDPQSKLTTTWARVKTQR